MATLVGSKWAASKGIAWKKLLKNYYPAMHELLDFDALKRSKDLKTGQHVLKSEGRDFSTFSLTLQQLAPSRDNEGGDAEEAMQRDKESMPGLYAQVDQATKVFSAVWGRS